MPQTKRVSIDHLKPGMYVVELDQPWFKTPFLRHRLFIKDQQQIEQLRRADVREVVIDCSRSLGGAETTTEVADRATRAPVQPERQPGPGASARLVPAATRRPPSRSELAKAREVRKQAVASVERILEGIGTGVPVDRPALQSLVSEIFQRILENQPAFVTQTFLQQMQRVHDDLFAHSVDVCVLSLVVGREHGLTRTQLEELGMGALLHDVGQLRLPRGLLRRGGPQTARETQLWEQHPQLGVTLLFQAGELPESAHRIVAEHHERADGSGFPRKLKRAELSPLSQIVGMVDTYDRLVSGREGHPPLPAYSALHEVFVLGLTNKFDRILVEKMVQSLGVYPVGSLVRLNTGERGVVVAHNREQRLKPVLRLISDPNGREYPNPPILDLSAQETNSFERTILQALDPSQEQLNLDPYLDR